MTHWCHDIPRDEAVRAAEDNRPGPLPTLEEAIARAGQFMPPQAQQEQNCTERESGLRTERVTLEITQFPNSGYKSPSEWPWEFFLRGEALTHGESVRVVEEAAPFAAACPIAGGTVKVDGKDMVTLTEFFWHTTKLTQEAGVAKAKLYAAIRRADAAEARVAELEAETKGLRCDVRAAETEADRLRGQLESVADRAAAAEMALEAAPAASVVPEVVREMTEIIRGNAEADEKHAAMATLVDAVCPGWRLAPAATGNSSEILTSSPAASGAAGTEPEFWGVRAKQSLAVPPGCASPRRVQSQPFQVFASEHEAQAEADRCGGVVFAIPGSEPAAPAASGAAGTATWFAAVGKFGMRHVCMAFNSFEECEKFADGEVRIVPLYAAPQPAPGWLTAEERGAIWYAIEGLREAASRRNNGHARTLESLLDRSSPPEVVRPGPWKDAGGPGHPQVSWQPFLDTVTGRRDSEWLAALAVAGVTVKLPPGPEAKEVNRE